MALVFKDARVELDSNDLTNYTTSATVSIEVADIETTNMGSGGNVERIGGLKDGSIQLEFNQDFAATKLDSILYPLLGTLVAFKIRPTQAAVGTGNPEYRGTVLVKEYSPIANGVGEKATVSVSFPTSGAVTRATS